MKTTKQSAEKMSSKPGRVIVTYGRSLMSLVIAQSLSRRGIEVIGCDDVDLTVLSFSKFVKDNFRHENPDDSEDAYIASLIENIEKFRPDDDRPYMLMPVFRNTRIIARHRKLLEPHITVAAPSWESISKIFPKENLAATAVGVNANVPKTLYINDSSKVSDKIKSLHPPVMIKPTAGVGGRGIKTFDTLDEAQSAYTAFIEKHGEAPLIQEKVLGADYCFTGLFHDGELLAHMAYRNLKRFPRETGAGAIRETINDEIFIEPAKKLMAATGWNGVAEVDFLWTENDEDEPYIIEVNPRFWAGLFHSVKSGVDFPWLLYQLFAFGEVKGISEAKIGEITKVPGLWLASMAQEIADSDIHFDRIRGLWNKESDVSIVKRISGSISVLKDAVDLDDACYRIMESMQMAKHSSDELSERDDPLTSLGILFVLSSLARHGKLPEEIKI